MFAWESKDLYCHLESTFSEQLDQEVCSRVGVSGEWVEKSREVAFGALEKYWSLDLPQEALSHCVPGGASVSKWKHPHEGSDVQPRLVTSDWGKL